MTRVITGWWYFARTAEREVNTCRARTVGHSPAPTAAARLSPSQTAAALERARCRDVDVKADRIQATLSAPHLGQPESVTGAYAASPCALVAVIAAIDVQVKDLQREVGAHFGRRPAASIIVSRLGLGPIIGARVLAGLGDGPDRYADAKDVQELRRYQPDPPWIEVVFHPYQIPC
jgi:hypothetical protein